MKTYKVYKLTSPSNKCYIGFTSDTINKRFSQHKQSYKQWVKSDRSRTGVCTKLFYAFDSHTPDAFIHALLFESVDKQEALDYEIKTIADLNTIENGYNLCIGGTSGFAGIKQTPEHRQRLSDARKAYYETPEGIEWKKKLSEKYKTNNPSYKGMESRLGHHTEESKAKISRSKLGKPNLKLRGREVSQEQRNKISAANIGKVRTTDQKEAQRQRMLGHKQTDYQKQKAAEALRKIWIIIHPDGKEETVVDLKAFCRANNLNSPSNFSSVAKGKLPHYRGFKARYA